MQYNVCDSGAYFMYMWLVLSTFLAILAGYSLPMRSDAPEQLNVPAAEAHLTKLLINHRIAQEYIKHKSWPNYCEDGDIADCHITKRIGYAGGSDFDKSLLEEYITGNYVTNGFAISDEFNINILCLNDDGSEATDCKNVEGNEKKRYLFTYGDLLEKWLSSSNLHNSEEGGATPVVLPNEDILKALSQKFGDSYLVGYVLEGESEQYLINHKGQQIYTIPPAVWSEMYASGICNIKYNGSCIAYISEL